MLEIVEQSWAQNQENKSFQFHVTINQTLSQKRAESLKLEETFTRAVSRKTVIQFMVRSEFSPENCLCHDRLVTLRLRNLNTEAIQECSLPNLKLLTLPLTLLNMILSWWARMGSLISWKMNRFRMNFGTWEISLPDQTEMKKKAKNSHSSGKLLLESSQNPWKICHMTILQLYLLFLTAKID